MVSMFSQREKLWFNTLERAFYCAWYFCSSCRSIDFNIEAWRLLTRICINHFLSWCNRSFCDVLWSLTDGLSATYGIRADDGAIHAITNGILVTYTVTTNGVRTSDGLIHAITNGVLITYAVTTYVLSSSVITWLYTACYVTTDVRITNVTNRLRST